MSFKDRVSSSRGSNGRRLIKLIFAGRNRIIMIRRELPLTISASQVEPVANVLRGFSFVLAPAAADPAFELDDIVHCPESFLFFPIWKAFAFVCSVLVMLPFVACRLLQS